MDSDETEKNESGNRSEKDEKMEIAGNDAVQPECELINEVKNVNGADASTFNEIPSVGNDENDVALVAKISPVIDSSGNKVTIETIEAMESGEVGKNLENINIDNTSIQVSEVNEASETTDDIESESVQEKSEDEPMDIDEILNSLNTDNETATSSDDAPPQIDAGNVPQLPALENEEQDIMLLSDSENDAETYTKEEENNIKLPECKNEAKERTDIRETASSVGEHTSEPLDLIPPEIENNEADSAGVEAKSPSNKNDTNVTDVAEFSNHANLEVADSAPELEQNEEGPLNESVNVLDLLRENEDLFGQIEKLDDTQSYDSEVKIQAEDEKKVNEPEISGLEECENTNENTDVDTKAESVKPEEEPDIPKDESVITEGGAVDPEEEPIIPEKRLVNPEVEPANPEVEPAIPEEGLVNPEVEPANPEVEPAFPEEGLVNPEVEPAIPEEGPVNPEVEPAIPEEGLVNPEEEPAIPEEGPVNPEEEPVIPEEKPIVRRECLNVECSKDSDIFYEAPEFVVNHFHLNKRPKILYVCEQCYDSVTESYGELCAALEDRQPLFLQKMKHNDLVEIIDSSDDEEDSDSKKDENVDKCSLDAETLALIENELEAVIHETLNKVDIEQQMDWNRQILTAKIDNNEKNCTEMMNEMKTLQSRIDKLYTDTYNFRHNFIEEVQSLDLTTLKPTEICHESYPPAGELKYHDIQFNTLYYTFRNRIISRWLPCKVVDKVDVNGQIEYVVRFCRDKKEGTSLKKNLRKHLAYGRAPDYRLNIGTRVIALFDDADNSQQSTQKSCPLRNNFYPGVIAEPLSLYTRWRYLVFFDDGWVQYVHHENIRVVCEATENVWELIEEPGAKTFIEGYVKELKNKRPIVQLRSGQRIQTEYGGKWYTGIVNNVDGSLVQIFFEDQKRYEWIYRGSTRLFPLYKKLNQQKAQTKSVNEATIEYIVIEDDKEPERSTESPIEEVPKSGTPPPKVTPIQRTFASQAARDTPQQKQREQKRAVAKKSTAPHPKPAIQHMNNSTIYVDEDKPKGKVVYYTAKKHIDVNKYIRHECSPSCLIQVQHNLSTYSPLSKPLLSGFERQICKTRFNKKFVMYRAPCGRRLRDMYEMHKYLRMTNSKLNVDNFTFDPLIHCLAEYVIDSYVMKKADLSGGIEKMPVQLINCYDTTTPPPCVYSAKRIPTEGVDLSTDSGFLCGCDCTDDCLDKTKCACWQLTLQGAKYGNPDTPIQEVGYEYKRLNEPVPTGIYECNAQCKCKSSCLNRVVQHPLQLKLQVFKTVNRGWGLRCLNDVPRGSFICCYAGNLLTETSANEAGEDLGDEYFAELDYIEVVENMKEGYEPEAINDNDEPDSSESDEDFDVEKEIQSHSDDEFVARSYTASEDSESRRYRTRNSVDTRRNPDPKSSAKTQTKDTEKRKERGSSSDEDGDKVRQVKNFMASNTMPLNDEPDDDRGRSIRKLFGKNEAVYIMDAKKAGNIGRYFNHSCGPNLFVQNVFVDTHDLRFPWVAFFASTHIRAGTELTWNYNYEVGSVPGKVLICQCGDEKCRGRIL